METYLPEGITEAPQDPEHLHIGLIKGSSSLVQSYIPVSDDRGETLGDPDLEAKVRILCEQIQRGEIDSLDLEKLNALTAEYSRGIARAATEKSGVLTKYRIRQGSLFIALKTKVRKSDLRWGPWFQENYHGILDIRSAQMYMKVAMVPNIIRYSVFGIKRLVEIIRAIDENDSKDPVGDFLQEHSILFDPETEPEQDRAKAVKRDIDTTIAIRKLEEAGLEDIDHSLVRSLISKVDFTDQRVKKIAEKDDPISYLRELNVNGGKESDANQEVRPHLDRILADLVDGINDLISYPEDLKIPEGNLVVMGSQKMKELEAFMGKC